MSTQEEMLIQRIEHLIQRRSSTDRRMGYAWMLVPVLPVLLGIVFIVSFIGLIVSQISKVGNLQQAQSALPAVAAILALYGLAIFFFYLVLLVGALALYYLVERRNNHFGRQQQLFSNLQSYLSLKVGESASGNIFRLAHSNEESIFEERDRPAGLWSVLYLFVTPIVALIVAHNLTQDLRRHEELQSSYQNELGTALSESGFEPTPSATFRLHGRDPLLFVILTAITGGLFWIYWFYTLLKDYNEHFQDQSQFEDQVLDIIRPQPATKICSKCGTGIPQNARFCPFCGGQQVS